MYIKKKLNIINLLDFVSMIDLETFEFLVTNLQDNIIVATSFTNNNLFKCRMKNGRSLRQIVEEKKWRDT